MVNGLAVYTVKTKVVLNPNSIDTGEEGLFGYPSAPFGQTFRVPRGREDVDVIDWGQDSGDWRKDLMHFHVYRVAHVVEGLLLGERSWEVVVVGT